MGLPRDKFGQALLQSYSFLEEDNSEVIFNWARLTEQTASALGVSDVLDWDEVHLRWDEGVCTLTLLNWDSEYLGEADRVVKAKLGWVIE